MAEGLITPDELRRIADDKEMEVYRQAVVKLHGFRKHPHEGVHKAAHVDKTASVGADNLVLLDGRPVELTDELAPLADARAAATDCLEDH